MPASTPRQLDSAIASVAALLGTHRSCIFVVLNKTSVGWHLARRAAHLGMFPATPTVIAPWSTIVFGATCLPALPGAGCAGAVSYRNPSRTAAFEIQFDVPYAGESVATAKVAGPATRAIGASVRRDRNRLPLTFYVSLEARNRTSHLRHPTGDSTP